MPIKAKRRGRLVALLESLQRVRSEMQAERRRVDGSPIRLLRLNRVAQAIQRRLAQIIRDSAIPSPHVSARLCPIAVLSSKKGH